ncbi:MAG: exodeoxyribonuclease VII large subunit [Chromatiales bacterium]|nr:exodeoxyribonuclease VII large subunit [Chromatiales bacterium]
MTQRSSRPGMSPPEPPALLPEREVFSVTRLNQEAQLLLETGLPLLWVEGELSNLARPASGHLYFTLKDSGAQVRCALFRQRGLRLGFTPRDGMQVLVRGRVSLYVPRGDYQLIVEQMEEAGHGALQRAFEALKQKLATEGLFDPAHKRPLPAFPKRVGVITSPTGAAIRDVLSVLRRRFPALPVLIYPVPVQGAGAAEKIAAAIRLASERQDCDVLILTRGGGSLEDLWAFNEEVVARAVHACRIPIVCGVGHEIDFSIADFVADQRAPTPSAAAELVSPDAAELVPHINSAARRLRANLRDRLTRHRQTLRWLEGRLHMQHPERRLRERSQSADLLETRLGKAIEHHLARREATLSRLRLRLGHHSPARRVAAAADRNRLLHLRLRNAADNRLSHEHGRIVTAMRALHVVSPLATLERGYGILTDHNGKVIRHPDQVAIGDALEARVAGGKIGCVVTEKRSAKSSM